MILGDVVIWGSGHRPNKLGPVDNKLDYIIEVNLKLDLPRFVISGMADGYDMRLAKVAIRLKIPLIAAIPFKEHIKNTDDYQYVMDHAAYIHYVERPGYAPWKYQVRNQWMVNNGTKGLVCWDGSPGGTNNCLKYARSVKAPFKNIWEDCLATK